MRHEGSEVQKECGPARAEHLGYHSAMALKVIHSHPVWLGNTMTWLYNEVVHLPAAEIESHIVCHRTENLDQFAVPNVHSLEDLPAWKRRLDRGLQRIHVRRHLGLLTDVAGKIDARVLHSHFGNIGYADRGAARARRLAHVVSFYGRDVSQLPRRRAVWRDRYWRLFDSADRILSMGDFMSACLRDLGCPEEKLKEHHLGVRVADFPFVPRVFGGAGDSAAAGSDSAGAGAPLKLLVAAMFREKKGIPYAIEAAAIASRRGASIELTVIGDATASPEDQAEKARIMDAVARSGMAERIRFLGTQTYEALMRHAYRHHVFVSPSVTSHDGDTEGGVALPVIEMAATGMPVVATRHADTPSVITDEVSGLLAPERDAEALAERILRLYAAPERWGVMVAAARRHVEAEFDAEVQGRRLAAIYQEVAGR
jgi:colanic acid/amylovoran biosynthesis glycosyltransferase